MGPKATPLPPPPPQSALRNAPAKIRDMEIDINNRGQWTKCDGNCPFYNVGTVGNNFCCEACSRDNGMHGKRCLGSKISDGPDQSTTPRHRAGKCPHGNDVGACKPCAKERGSVATGRVLAGLLPTSARGPAPRANDAPLIAPLEPPPGLISVLGLQHGRVVANPRSDCLDHSARQTLARVQPGKRTRRHAFGPRRTR